MADPLPMPTPTVPKRPFPSFKILTLDIYGTLIDWETGIMKALSPLLSQIPPTSPDHDKYSDIDIDNPKNQTTRTELAGIFNEIEADLQSKNPGLKYSTLLAEAYLALASRLSISNNNDNLKSQATAFGASISQWPAFTDTVDAMSRLSLHYRLVPLSNVDRESFAGSRSGPLEGKIPFWRVCTAQDIGSYKPDLKNFEYLLRYLNEEDRREDGGQGIGKADVLHVAQSLFHDHVPAKKMGMSSVWINRKGAGMGNVDGAEAVHLRNEIGYGWRFNTLGEFADEVEKQFAQGTS